MILVDNNKVTIVEPKRGKDKRKRRVKRTEIPEPDWAEKYGDDEFRDKHRT